MRSTNSMSLASMCALWYLPLPPTNAQIRLILGKPNTLMSGAFSAATAEVSADGKVTLRETLIDGAQSPGFRWFDIDYDRQRAFLLNGHREAIVLDLVQDSVTKRCAIPSSPGKRSLQEWLVDDPMLGPIITFLRINGEISQDELVGFITDPLLPCSESIQNLRREQVSRYASAGDAGVSGEAHQNPYAAVLDHGVVRGWVGGEPIWFPMPFDPALAKLVPSQPNSVGICVRNREIEAISVSLGTLESQSFWARERGDGQWFRLPYAPGEYLNPRGFGRYLVWPEAIDAGSQNEQIKKNPKLEPNRKRNAHVGEWRKEPTKWGMSTEWALVHSTSIYPGTLHILDVKTRKHFLIETGQSDSEVLLIERGTILYRASDRLYSVEINGESLGVSRKIAQSDLIRDAHWAYFARRNRSSE